MSLCKSGGWIRGLAECRSPRGSLLTVFTLHNLEEIAAVDSVVVPLRVLNALNVDASWYRRDRFAAATTLLTVAVAWLTPSVNGIHGRRAGLLAAAAVGGLAANAIGHLGRAAVMCAYNPGAASAPALLVSSIDSLRRIQSNEDLSAGEVLAAAFAGAVLSLPAIAISLIFAKAVIR